MTCPAKTVEKPESSIMWGVWVFFRAWALVTLTFVVAVIGALSSLVWAVVPW